MYHSFTDACFFCNNPYIRPTFGQGGSPPSILNNSVLNSQSCFSDLRWFLLVGMMVQSKPGVLMNGSVSTKDMGAALIKVSLANDDDDDREFNFTLFTFQVPI